LGIVSRNTMYIYEAGVEDRKPYQENEKQDLYKEPQTISRNDRQAKSQIS